MSVRVPHQRAVNRAVSSADLSKWEGTKTRLPITSPPDYKWGALFLLLVTVLLVFSLPRTLHPIRDTRTTWHRRIGQLRCKQHLDELHAHQREPRRALLFLPTATAAGTAVAAAASLTKYLIRERWARQVLINIVKY